MSQPPVIPKGPLATLRAAMLGTCLGLRPEPYHTVRYRHINRHHAPWRLDPENLLIPLLVSHSHALNVHAIRERAKS